MRILGAVLERANGSRPYAASHPIQVRVLELDPPEPGEILVRIEIAGVCHSDLSVVNGSRPRPIPMLLGHEAAGIVEGIGAGVQGIELGQRVVTTFLPRCEECHACASGGRAPCTNGSASNSSGTLLRGGSRLHIDGVEVRHHLGVSGFATYAVLDRRSVVVVPPDVPARIAAMMGCAVLTGGGAVINSGQLRTGETLAVVGLGGVGMAALLTGLAHEGVRVIGIDARPEKLSSAREFGAHEVYLPGEASGSAIRADVVVEAVGSANAFEAAIALTAPGGRTVTVGLPPVGDSASVSPLTLVAEGRSIIGSYMGSSVPSRDVPIFVDMWRAGRLPLEKLISAEIELENINEAMDQLADGNAIRQLIVFDENRIARVQSVGSL
ncbi:MAG: alcohol dehydrogenase catalytic domain-containing protein [Candidatus Nanopelagicaceae bacterium]|nr:alcohol dehydrogenase catalytic domain-containing protein [Candidatus Nanopelagicaceae bacterium]